MGGFIIDQRETLCVCQNILRAVIAMTKCQLSSSETIYNWLDCICYLRSAFLNPKIKRFDSQLLKDVVIREAFNQVRSARGAFMYLSQDPPGSLCDRLIDMACKECLLPHLGRLRCMTHGEDKIGPIAEKDFRYDRRGQQRVQNLHDFLLAINPFDITDPGIASS